MKQANFKQAVFVMIQVMNFTAREKACPCKIRYIYIYIYIKGYLEMDDVICQAYNYIFL